MPKISFVIPIYNGEKFIQKCLDSILKEKEFDFEVILVDDGSTDNTKNIIEDIASKDNRVKAFSVYHRGVSMSRNYGLKEASGDYINFLDIDDYLLDNYFSIVSNRITSNDDLYVFGYDLLFIDEGYKISVDALDKSYDNQTIAESLKDMFELDLFNFPWNKLYKKEILNELAFSDDFYQGEDLAFNCEVMKKCNTITMIKDCMYVYIKRNIETMTSKFVKNYSLVLKNKYGVLKDLFDTLDPQHKYNQVFDDYMVKEYEVFVINLYKTNNYKKEDRIELIKENVLNEVALKQIKDSKPNTSYSKLFKKVAKTNNPKFINTVYKTLYYFKSNFSDSYLKLRKKIYLKDDKRSS